MSGLPLWLEAERQEVGVRYARRPRFRVEGVEESEAS